MTLVKILSADLGPNELAYRRQWHNELQSVLTMGTKLRKSEMNIRVVVLQSIKEARATSTTRFPDGFSSWMGAFGLPIGKPTCFLEASDAVAYDSSSRAVQSWVPKTSHGRRKTDKGSRIHSMSIPWSSSARKVMTVRSDLRSRGNPFVPDASS